MKIENILAVVIFKVYQQIPVKSPNVSAEGRHLLTVNAMLIKY